MSLYNVNRVFEKIARTKIGDMLIRSIENGQVEWFYRKEAIVRTGDTSSTIPSTRFFVYLVCS